MIDVIWWNQSRGNWDSGLICSIIDRFPERFHQHNAKDLIYPERAIVIVVGKPKIAPLNTYLHKLQSGLVILTSDEDSEFMWREAIPPRFEIWTQYYSPNKESIKERLLLGVPNRFKHYNLNTHLPKKYLWSFVGQVQNPYRQECVDWLKKMPDGFLHIAEAFGGMKKGIAYQEYLDIMCQSKYVICPSGSMCADCFRVYEAMECGAIPIVNAKSPRDKEGFNYWNEVYPKHKLSSVERWGDIEHLNQDPIEVDVQNQWWFDYKDDLETKLLQYANSI